MFAVPYADPHRGRPLFFHFHDHFYFGRVRPRFQLHLGRVKISQVVQPLQAPLGGKGVKQFALLEPHLPQYHGIPHFFVACNSYLFDRPLVHYDAQRPALVKRHVLDMGDGIPRVPVFLHYFFQLGVHDLGVDNLPRPQLQHLAHPVRVHPGAALHFQPVEWRVLYYPEVHIHPPVRLPQLSGNV